MGSRSSARRCCRSRTCFRITGGCGGCGSRWPKDSDSGAAAGRLSCAYRPCRQEARPMQRDLARQLKFLHEQAAPLMIYNAWDAGSAGAIRDAGAPVIATSSWAIAAAQGYDDGEQLPFDVLAQIAARIVAKVDVPVTVDVEGGYAGDGAGVARNVARLLDAGVVGINFEDRIVKGKGLYDIDAQSARIAAIRAMADERGIALFINARSDVYFDSGIAGERRLAEAKARAAAYQRAGASGFFAPGLAD